jgi:hypothetical protein
MALTRISDRGAAVQLSASGWLVRSPTQWSSVAQVTNADYPPGYGLQLHYVPLGGTGAFAGRFIALFRERLRVLNDDGSGCFPADSRKLPDIKVPTVMIPNEQTGGFAVLYPEGTSLMATIYLSNGAPF